jgi:hypothetical protein
MEVTSAPLKARHKNAPPFTVSPGSLRLYSTFNRTLAGLFAAAVGLEATTYGPGTARLAPQKKSRDRRNMDKGLVAVVRLEPTTYGL